ncbi:hypothetical protein [Nocardiopsis coralliicola]
MGEKTKVTLEELEKFGNQIEAIRKDVSALKTRSDEHYGGDDISIPLGNAAFLPQASMLSKEVAGVLTQFSTSITDLEKRLTGIVTGIRNSKAEFSDLEADAELSAQQVAKIMSTGATPGSGGGGPDSSSGQT